MTHFTPSIFQKWQFCVYLILCLLLGSNHYTFATSDFHRFSKTPLSHHFTNNDYRGGIQNWSISQNESGILYVANSYGLLEFDGVEWRTHNASQITRMLSIHVAKNNIIYAGGQNQIGYFTTDPIGNMQYISLLDKLPHEDRIVDDVWKVIGLNGKVFFGTNLGVYIYDGETLQKVPFKNDGGYIFKVSSHLFAYSPTDGLLEWNQTSFNPVKNGHLLAGSSIIEILPYQSDNYLLFQSNGEIKIYGNGQIKNWKHDNENLLKTGIINTAMLLSNNQIAIGTQNHGLIIFEPNGTAVLQIDKRKGLNSNTVLSIHEDAFKNLWIGQANGLSYLETGSPFSLIDERLGVPGTGYTATFVNNHLYLGTNNGLFYQNSGTNTYEENQQYYRLVTGTEGQVYSIDQQRNLLLMGHHRGGFLIEDGSSSHFFDKIGVWKYKWNEEKEKFLMGTYNGFYQFNSIKSDAVAFEEFYESSRLFEFENDTIVWMSHGYKGVFRILFDDKMENIKEVKYYNENHGFPSRNLINIFKVGNQLFFPAETGIYQYNPKNDRFELHKKFTELMGPTEHISVINTAVSGEIYFISNNEFGVLKSDLFENYHKITDPFHPINKYISDNLENITIIDHENILIGAKDGLIHYNPSFIKYIPENFEVYIRSISIRKEKDSVIYAGNLPLPQNFGFEKNISSIRFNFATPHFDGFQGTLYRYKLEKFDKEWSDWSTLAQKEYTNLPFGKYNFIVEAKNIYGAVSKPASVTFKIIPPWYLTNIAFGFYISFIFIIFGFTLYWLDSKHRVDKKKMEMAQVRKIHQKNLEIEEVAKTSEHTITQLRNEKLKTEVEFKNKELVSTTMHLLNKNEFMINLKTKLDGLIKTGQPKSDEIKRIIKTINKNIDEDANWDQFTMHFDQVHGDFLKKLTNLYPDLSPQDIKLAAYLRINLTSKDIAQLLSISVRGVEISRYRLRKKLNIDRNTNLVTFMMNL